MQDFTSKIKHNIFPLNLDNLCFSELNIKKIIVMTFKVSPVRLRRKSAQANTFFSLANTEGPS